MAKKNYYAVRVGRRPGIYKSWPECQQQVNGYPGAIFKGFGSQGEAEAFLGAARHRTPQPLPLSTTLAGGVHKPEGAKRSHSKAPVNDHADTVDEPTSTAHIAILQSCRAAAKQAASRVTPAQVNRAPGAYWVHFDGGSRGNPGVGGSGAVITDIMSKAHLAEIVLPLPYGNTNNVAEYCGLIVGLMACGELGIRAPIVRGDSKLVACQMNGTYKVRMPHLKPFHAEACALMATLYSGLPARPVEHVRREDNGVADRLSNEAMDLAARHRR